jgi:hypothetical protein
MLYFAQTLARPRHRAGVAALPDLDLAYVGAGRIRAVSAFAGCGQAVAYALARFVPDSDILRALFNHLVGQRE